MDDRITEKVALFTYKAMEIPKDHQSPDVDVPHLLKALIDDSDSMFKNICLKQNISLNAVSNIVEQFISNKVKSNSDNVYPSTDFNFLINNAEKYKREYQDTYLSVEHIILSLFDNKHIIVKKLLEIQNFNKVNFKEAINKIRGNNKVEDTIPENKYEVL